MLYDNDSKTFEMLCMKDDKVKKSPYTFQEPFTKCSPWAQNLSIMARTNIPGRTTKSRGSMRGWSLGC